MQAGRRGPRTARAWSSSRSQDVVVLMQPGRGGPRPAREWRSSRSQGVEVLTQPGRVRRGAAKVEQGMEVKVQLEMASP